MKKITIFLLIILGLLLLGSSVYFYSKYRDASAQLKEMSLTPEEEMEILISSVGKLIDLPADEQPTVATVTDKEKLVGQKFFARSENGDKVIIFVKEQKAILYRPSMNKIVEVARIDSIDQNVASTGTATVSAVPTAIKKIEVTILNGSSNADVVSKAERVIVDSGLGFSVLKKSNTKFADYENTLVVNLGAGSDIANKMQSLLGVGGVVTKMPEGEATPSSQLVVILGNDYTGY